MADVLRSVLALLVSIFLLLAGNSLQFVILGLRAEAESFSLFTIGLLTAGYYVGYAFGTLKATKVVQTVGYIRAFAAAASLVSAVVLAHAVWVEPAVWVILRIVTGFSFATAATVIESWLNAKATSAVRGKVLSVGSAVLMSGYALGPLLLSLGSARGFLLFVFASILMSVALLPVLLTRFEAPAISEADETSYSLARLYRECPFGLVATVGVGMIQGAFLGMGSIVAGSLGLGEVGSARYMTLGLLAGIFVQFPLGYMSDRTDRRTVLGFAFTFLGIAATLLSVALPSGAAPLWLVLISAVVAGVAAMPLYSIVIAQVNDQLPEKALVPAAATLILSFSLGSVTAGPTASFFMERMGPSGFFAFFAAVLLPLGVYCGHAALAAKSSPYSWEDSDVEYDSFMISPTAGLLPLEWIHEEEPDQLLLDFEEEAHLLVQDG